MIGIARGDPVAVTERTERRYTRQPRSTATTGGGKRVVYACLWVLFAAAIQYNARYLNNIIIIIINTRVTAREKPTKLCYKIYNLIIIDARTGSMDIIMSGTAKNTYTYKYDCARAR